MKKPKAICSACLLGVECRYDGTSKPDSGMIRLFEKGRILQVCPEMLGGMGCPRDPCEITGGSGADVLEGSARVIDSSGKDVTKRMIAGAQQTLEICNANHVKKAYLTEKSPSCGVSNIHDGNFKGVLVAGEGVTAALLRKNGFKIIGK
jgi:uncharacterized protein YbbK (DUF523 family)